MTRRSYVVSVVAFVSAMLASGCRAGSTLACGEPQRLLYFSGEPSGFVRCSDRALDRVEALPVPEADALPSCEGDEDYLGCTTDADCDDGPLGHCAHYEAGTAPAYVAVFCDCVYHCVTDADCGAEEACLAPEVAGGAGNPSCVPATCRDAADCGSGECGLSVPTENLCGAQLGLACRSAGVDECHAGAACLLSHEGSCGVLDPWMDGSFECPNQDCIE